MENEDFEMIFLFLEYLTRSCDDGASNFDW